MSDSSNDDCPSLFVFQDAAPGKMLFYGWFVRPVVDDEKPTLKLVKKMFTQQVLWTTSPEDESRRRILPHESHDGGHDMMTCHERPMSQCHDREVLVREPYWTTGCIMMMAT